MMTVNIRMAALAACVLSIAMDAAAQEPVRAVSVGLTAKAVSASESTLESAIPAPEPDAAAQNNARVEQGPKLKGFSVVLLSGESPGASTTGEPSGEIPPAVQKALSNVQAFLPYKTYRLYDAALLPTVTTTQGSSALMRGDVYNTRLRVSIMWPIGSRSQGDPLLLTLMLTELASSTSNTNATDSVLRTIMNTSISISSGETVVVGTSRTAGGRALIALLTAIPE
jgi:hypothetical protein